MKRFFCLLLIALATVFMASCAKAVPQTAEPTLQPTEGAINPGGRIGDFLITTGEEGNVTYGFDQDCVKQGNGENYSCKVPVGAKINITTGIYDDTVRSAPTTATPKLNEDWSSFEYELFIEDRPVNLQAFGYIDAPHSMTGVIRFWKVVMVAGKPGKITIRDSGVVHGAPFESTTTYTFTAP